MAMRIRELLIEARDILLSEKCEEDLHRIKRDSKELILEVDKSLDLEVDDMSGYFKLLLECREILVVKYEYIRNMILKGVFCIGCKGCKEMDALIDKLFNKLIEIIN